MGPIAKVMAGGTHQEKCPHLPSKVPCKSTSARSAMECLLELCIHLPPSCTIVESRADVDDDAMP